MHEVEALRSPTRFGWAQPGVTLSEGGALARTEQKGGGFAASKAVMRSGRHFAQVTLGSGLLLYFGVARPNFMPAVPAGRTKLRNAHQVHEHCFYVTRGGHCWPAKSDWNGRQGAGMAGDRVGLLLDLDDGGSITVFKNDRPLGVMATGLSGEFCWSVVFFRPGFPTRLQKGRPLEKPVASVRICGAGPVEIFDLGGWGLGLAE
jgi:hypothetical protein